MSCGRGIKHSLHEGGVFAHVVLEEICGSLAVDRSVGFEFFRLELEVDFRGIQLRCVEEAEHAAHARLHHRSAALWMFSL